MQKFTGEHQYRSVISTKLQNNFIEITTRYGYYPVNLLHILTPFLKSISGGLFLNLIRLILFTHLMLFVFFSISHENIRKLDVFRGYKKSSDIKLVTLHFSSNSCNQRYLVYPNQLYYRYSRPRCSVNKVFFGFLQNSQEISAPEFLF